MAIKIVGSHSIKLTDVLKKSNVKSAIKITTAGKTNVDKRFTRGE